MNDDEIDGLRSLLPKVKIVTHKEEYLASLTEADRRRYLLREYFHRKHRRRPMLKPDRRLQWIVLTTPFPQLFEYKEGDEELFAPFSPIRFDKFREAHEVFKGLIRAALKKAQANCTAGRYQNVAKLREV